MSDAIARLEALAARPAFEEDQDVSGTPDAEGLREAVRAAVETLPRMTYYLIVQTPGEDAPDGDDRRDDDDGGEPAPDQPLPERPRPD